MLIKNPILIFDVFWYTGGYELAIDSFTLIVLPAMGWIMGTVGKKVKKTIS